MSNTEPDEPAPTVDDYERIMREHLRDVLADDLAELGVTLEEFKAMPSPLTIARELVEADTAWLAAEVERRAPGYAAAWERVLGLARGEGTVAVEWGTVRTGRQVGRTAAFEAAVEAHLATGRGAVIVGPNGLRRVEPRDG